MTKSRALDLLEQLLRVTPVPPGPDTDPGLVLEQGAVVAAARDELLEQLRVVLGDVPDALQGDEVARERLCELRMRGAAWSALVTRATRCARERVSAVRRRRRQRARYVEE